MCVMSSIARGPRFFKWKMLRVSGPYAIPTALDCTGDLFAGE